MQDIHDNAYSHDIPVMSSPHTSTKVCLNAVSAVLNQLSRMTPYGDVVSSGVDPMILDAYLKAWMDDIARTVGDKQLSAALLGAFRRAVVTLEQHTGITDAQLR